MKKKILQLGYGPWGQKVYSKIKHKYEVYLIKNRKEFKKKIIKKNFDKFDLVILTSTNNQNLKLIKFFAGKVRRIFCEKPLCDCVAKMKSLLDYCVKKKTKIFISEIEIYKKKPLILKDNFIIRGKSKKYESVLSILKSLVYHDLYLFADKINVSDIKISKVEKYQKNLLIEFRDVYSKFLCIYKTDQADNYHFINGINMTTNKDFILNMINDAVILKNYKDNNLRALKATQILEKLKNK